MALPPRFRRSEGFTLVEVTLALGIVAFAFVALLALLPAGNLAFRRSIDLAICGQIAQRVIADAQNADFDVMTKSPSGGLLSAGDTFTRDMRYFDDQGREIIPRDPKHPTPEEARKAVYWVNTRIMPSASLPRYASRKDFSTVKSDAGEVKPTNPLAQITVQVVHNPNAIQLTLSSSASSDVTKPDRNLVLDSRAAKTQLDIFTYSAMIGRNN